MMNLSINLTLGSPGAESVLNTAPAAEEGDVDSFSLKLADELSEQELTPSIVVEDTRAVDPALLEAIAARQKLAADSEVVTEKDGRVWLDDPLAGLPVAAEHEAELTEPVTEDKPWFDIIEKAKSYGPALQANKTPESSNTAAVALNKDHALVGAEDLPQLPSVDLLLSPEQTVTASTEAMTAEAELETAWSESNTIALNKADSTAASAALTAAMVAADEMTASELQVITGPEAKATELVSSGVTQQGALSQLNNDKISQTAVEPPVADQQVISPEFASNNIAPQQVAATPSAASASVLLAAPVTADPESATTLKTAPALGADVEAIAEQSIIAIKAESVPATAPAGHTETAKDVEPGSQPAAEVNASGSVLAAAASNENVVPAAPQLTDPLQQAELVTAAIAVPVSPGRTSATVSSDKTQAANSFAEHLKAVNQSQQQQQQQQQHAGTEQQSGHSQAKAAIEMMVATQPVPTAANAASFSQQLHQLQPTQPLTEQTVTAALTQPTAHSAAAGQTTQQVARLAETPGWQAPLALTEPAAAQQLKDRVMVQIQHKLQTAEVQLHPEDMGAMQIKLNLQQDQLSVQFVVQQGAAKEALEQQMPRLRELLEQQGIALTEGQVEQRQSGGQQEQRQGGRSGPSGGAETDLAAVQTVQMKVSDRMVDFYA